MKITKLNTRLITIIENIDGKDVVTTIEPKDENYKKLWNEQKN